VTVIAKTDSIIIPRDIAKPPIDSGILP
jgi:hypothetical protein